MPFQNYLDTRYLRHIRKRKVLADFVYVTQDGEKITIEKGFVFDGGSIPRPFRPIVGGPWSDDVFEASCVHDWLVRLANQGKYNRARADSIFSQIIAEGHKPKNPVLRMGKIIKRKAMWAAVRVSGIVGNSRWWPWRRK